MAILAQTRYHKGFGLFHAPKHIKKFTKLYRKTTQAPTVVALTTPLIMYARHGKNCISIKGR